MYILWSPASKHVQYLLPISGKNRNAIHESGYLLCVFIYVRVHDGTFFLWWYVK